MLCLLLLLLLLLTVASRSVSVFTSAVRSHNQAVVNVTLFRNSHTRPHTKRDSGHQLYGRMTAAAAAAATATTIPPYKVF